MNSAVKRILSKDIKELKKLKLEEQGIFIEFDEKDILNAKAVIIGPNETPYENGILFFKIKFPINYPFSPPKVHYYSFSRIRIHPNLYVGKSTNNFEGKVCLSIINTWTGPKWTTIMHIGSVFISLLSILDNNPLRNEPGYENITGRHNDLYNIIVEYDKYNHLLLNNAFDLDDDFEIFRDRINDHLNKNKEDIMKTIDELCIKYPKVKKINTNLYGIKQLNIDYLSLREKLKKKFDMI